jgi:hypothetical protein
MKKLAKNIPSPFPSKGTPIFRDTTALPFAAGGPLHDRDINGNLLNSTYASPLGNMYREGGPFGEDQGTFDYASSVYASQPGNYFKDGGPVNTSGPRVDSTPALSDSAMKAKIAYEAAMGNKAAQRMLSLDPKTYDFGNGDYGTHYMSSIDNYAVPELQDKGEPQLANVGAFPPPSNEDFRFQTPEEADYFATHYKEISPMTTRQYKDGGQFQSKYSLPEDSFKQGGNNLHNSVYASSPQQYPAIYNFGGTLEDNLATRQQMYMPLDHITRTGGSILSMSNTPEMSGEGKDLVYANGGALNNSYAGGGQIYTYAGRPGAEYQKGANGWTIRTANTNGAFIAVQDPTGKRTALLNAQAKPTTTKSPYQLQQEAKAQAGQSGYDMMAGNKPQVSDNTKVQITNKPIPTVGTPIKTAEELAHDQFVAWGAEQDKKRNAQNPAIDPRTGNYRPMSAGEADWVWAAPLAGSAALQAAGAIGAMSLPGLSAVPGATVGNLVNSGFIANSLYNMPKNAGEWYDVSQGNKDWTEAALGTGEIALGMLGSGAGLKSIAQDVSQGSKYASKTASLKPEGKKVFGTYGHDIESNPNIVYKESESGNIIPFNNATGKPLQEEYVNNMKEYYNSLEFKRIMKEEYPDVDVAQYKKVTLENLEKELTYNPREVADNYGGVYTTKNSSSAAYMPGNAPTFKQRVANANTNDYQYQNNNGVSYISDPSTTWHELSHQRTNAAELLPNQLTRSHLEENALPFAENLEYHAMPTEFDVRLRQLKEDLKTQGINDYFNTPVTAEHISKLDASRLKDEGDFLFKEMKNQYRELKNSGASEDVLEKVKNQYFNNIGKLDEKMGTIKTSTDTQDLLKRWTPEFLAKKARTLPALFPAAGIAGGSALLANPWQQESKGL